MACSVEQKRQLVETAHEELSLQRQGELLGLARASYYYEGVAVSAEKLRLMNLLDEQYTKTPFYGVRKMTAWLNEVKEENVNVKRIRRLLRLMGLAAIYQKPRLSQAAAGHRIYPYLLRGVKIERVNQVWSTDIVCTQMTKPDGFTRRASGDGVTNFHLVVRDHDAINEQLHQLPALRKCSRR